MDKRKIKVEYSDNLLKLLISDYQSKECSMEEKNEISSLVHKYFYNLKMKKEIYKNTHINIFSPVPAISFITIIIIFLFSFLFFKMSTDLKSNLIFYEYNTDSPSVTLVTKNMIFDTTDNKTLKIQSDLAIFLLKEQSLFEIKRQEKIFVFNEHVTSNYYYLKFGSVYIDADKVGHDDQFEINTSFGKVRVIGTKFEISCMKNKLQVKCFEGKVEFIDTEDNQERNIIEVGNELIIEKIEGKNGLNNEINIIKKQIDKEDMIIPEIKRDIYNKFSKSEKQVNVLDIDTGRPKAEIYINNKLIEYGQMRYLFNIKESIDIMVKLEGFNEIKRKLDLKNSKKVFIALKKIKEKRFFGELLLEIKWQKKLNSVNNETIQILKDYIAIISKKDISILKKDNGEIIKIIGREKGQNGFYSYKNNLVYYESPNIVRIVTIPSFKVIYETASGLIASGGPIIDNSRLFVASTDHHLYIYDYIEKKLLNKYKFDSGFYCAPILAKDKVILNNEAKKIILFSIKNQKIVWEQKNTYKFIPDSVITNRDYTLIAAIDEKYKTYVYNLVNGNLLYSNDSDKIILHCFIDKNLLMLHNNTLIMLNKNGIKISEIQLQKNINGIFVNNNIIYLIYLDKIILFNKQLEKYVKIITNDNQLYNYADTELYLLSKDNVLTNYKL